MSKLEKIFFAIDTAFIIAAVVLTFSFYQEEKKIRMERIALEDISEELKLQKDDVNNTNLMLSIQNEKLEESNKELMKEIDKLKQEISDEASKKAAEELEAKATAASKATSNYTSNYSGQSLSPSKGSIIGPSGKETYYNLDMSVCIRIMRNLGYDAATYESWIREDGAKMLGSFVMVAANYQLRPRGTIVQTSLGPGIVVDTGGFAESNATQLDICVNW